MNTTRIDDDSVQRLAREIATQTGTNRTVGAQVFRAAAFGIGLAVIVFAFVIVRVVFFR